MTSSPTVTDISARLAGYYLYTSRGIVDQEDTRYNQLLMHKECAEDGLNDIQTARIVIEAELKTTVTFPTVEGHNASTT